MNKFLTYTLLLLTISLGSVANAAEQKEPCRDGKEVASKINNFNDADIDGRDYKVCGGMLLPIDKVLISNAVHVSDKETMSWFAPELTNFGANAEETIERMPDHNPLMSWIRDISKWALVAVAWFIIAVYLGSITHPHLNPQAVFATIKAALFAFSSFYINFVFTLLIILFVATYRPMMFNMGNHESIKEIMDMNVSKLVPAVRKNSTLTANAVTYVEAINTSTMNVRIDRNFGKSIEIDKTWSADGSDISDPTIAEYEAYNKECLSTDFVIVDTDTNIHLLNWDITNLVNKATFVSGGETENYNCDPAYYGVQVTLLDILNNTPNLLKRFFNNNFDQNMAKNLDWKEGLEAVVDRVSGALSIEMELAQETASQNPEALSNFLLLAEQAEVETRTLKKPFMETPSFLQLKKLNKIKMGTLFDYKEIEGVDAIGNVTAQTIMLNHYNFSEWFGNGIQRDPVVTDKMNNGYNVSIQPYVRETVLLAAELNCIDRNGFRYPDRKNYALHYNSIPKDRKLRFAGSFGGVSDAHCYVHNGDGTISAGADPSSREELKTLISDRTRAIDILQTARLQAGYELILANDTLDSKLVLDAINALSADMNGTVKSFTAVSQMKQQLVGALNTIEDANSFIYKIQFDTSRPQTYYNVMRMNEADKQEDLDLPKYDFSKILSINLKAMNEAQELDNENSQGAFSKAMMFDCPIKDQYTNECRASLAVQVAASNEMMKTQAITLLVYYSAVNFADGICGAKKEALKNTAGATIAQVEGFLPSGAICAGISGLDSLNGMIVKPLMVASVIAWGATQLASFLPIVLDLLLFIIAPMCFVIPFVISSLQFYRDAIIKPFIYFFATDRTEQDYKEMLAMSQSTRSIKSAIAVAFISLVILAVITTIILSPQLGGGLYDNIWGSFDGSLIQSIPLTFITIACITWLEIKVVFSLSTRLFNQTLELFDVKGQNLSNEASHFAEGMLTGALMTRGLSFTQNTANKMESGMNGLGQNYQKSVDMKNEILNLNDKPSSSNDTKQDHKSSKQSDDDVKEDSNVDEPIDNSETETNEPVESENEESPKEEMKHYKIEGDIMGKTQDEINTMVNEGIEKQDKLDESLNNLTNGKSDDK